jgi:hypothetical protein
MSSPPRVVLQGYIDDAVAAALAGQVYNLPEALTTRSKARFEAGVAQGIRLASRNPARAPARAPARSPARIPERFVSKFRSRRASAPPSSPRGVGMRARSLKAKPRKGTRR